MAQDKVWRIDRDHLENKPVCIWGDLDGCRTRDTRDNAPRIDVATAVAFRILDDDGELYYSGVMSHELYDSCDILRPLDDYATPNDGATSLQINKGNGWEPVN